MSPHLIDSMVTLLALGLLLGLTAIAVAVLPWSPDALRASELAWMGLSLLPGALMHPAGESETRGLAFERIPVDQLLPPLLHPMGLRRPLHAAWGKKGGRRSQTANFRR